MTVIYLGMALSGTPLWWHNRFHGFLLSELENIPDVKVSRFVGLKPDVSASEIFNYDINLAKTADMMLACTRFPSLGMGMEIQSRVDLKKPTLLFHPKGQYLSKMPSGAPGVVTME